MKKNLEDILTASICRFNVKIDIDGQLAPEISPDCCEEPCDYCRMAAKHVCKQIEDYQNDQQ